MKTTLLIAVGIAVLGRLLADDAKAWLGWLHRRLRRWAVSMLPEVLRDRYQEEWQSDLAEVPGEFAKLLYSLGLMWASVGIRSFSLSGQTRLERVLSSGARLLDIVVSSFVLLVVGPAMLLIAIAIKVDSPGPVFIPFRRAPSTGSHDLTSFRIFVSEKIQSAEPTTAPDLLGWGESASRYRVRVTPLGLFLRKYSLDLLPNFFDVLRGDARLIRLGAPPSEEGGGNVQCGGMRRGEHDRFGPLDFLLGTAKTARDIWRFICDLCLLVCGRFGTSNN